ncbi:lactose permease [Microdochium bolleyi]|uniref:Lactose permease n=1 Tax=Microdochium bolleyi TaxID=196109 RepID=A0A136JJM0_9PEZI|nr:lactose permease [Microdochium bolleyi]
MAESKQIHNVDAINVHDDLHTRVVVAEGSGKTANQEGAKAKVVHNAELYAAIQESPIARWSKESRHLYFSIFVAFCCACANGYDGSLMTGILAMPHFDRVYGTESDAIRKSLIMSLYTVGAIVCSPFAAILSDKLGRRKTMFAGGCVIIVGAIVAATSMTLPQIVVARFILGGGISIMTVGAPAYAVEISPPHWRGRAVGFYNCGWFGGSIPAALVTFGCNRMDSNLSWQIPLALQCFACVVVMISVWFIPESPRWLLANGREAEAVDFLATYHGNGSAQSRLVMLEIEEMKDGIRQDGVDKEPWNYKPLLLSHSGRWRMAQVLMISIFGQFSGNGLGYFNADIFKLIGITSVEDQLGYNVLNSVISAIGAGIAVCFTDTMPRRKVLIIGTFVCALTLAANGGLSETMAIQQESTGSFEVSYAKGALAAYFLFNFVVSFTYTPLQGVIPAEALETSIRAKGLASSGMIVNSIGFINLFAGPIALKNIKHRYIFVFVGWDCFESLMWYFFCVESQGRTLEQLEWVYDQPNPVKASLKVDKVVVQADGHVTEKITDGSDLSI